MLASRTGRAHGLAQALAVLVALAICAPRAVAQDDAVAKREYKLGWKELSAGNYDTALKHYRRSYRLAPRPRTLFNIAVCEEKLGRTLDARNHYSEFLEIAEARDAEFVERAKNSVEELTERTQGTIVVSSKPAGARVFVDGSDTAAGKTPVTLKLEEGEHRLRLTLPGAAPVARSVDVVAQRRSKERFSLNRKATIVITVQPRDAEIRMDNADHAAIGTLREEVSLGVHEFVVTRDGYRDEVFSMRAKAGRFHERDVRLRPANDTAVLIIRTNTTGASVSVDGMVVGTTSLRASSSDLPELRHPTAVGAHSVIVEGSDEHSWQRRLHLSPGETVAVDIRFREGSRLATWGIGGLGIAAVAAGGTIGVLALEDVRSDIADNHDRGKSRALTADVLLVAGAIALLTARHYAKKPSTTSTVERTHAAE